MSEDKQAAELQEKRIQRAAYKWNTISGLLNAFQSVIILMVVTRVCDVVTAGVFTLAYANGNLFLNVGKYGMRHYQASDLNAQFSFAEYRASRIVTVTTMLVTGGAYLVYLAVSNGYSAEKAAIVAIFCLYEAVAALEDVFFGNFQQHGRLDIAARLLTIRLASTITVMCVTVALSRSLLVAAIVAAFYTAMFLAAELVFAKRRYQLPVPDGGFAAIRVRKLLVTCFPLFAAAFLLFYIGNAPRYAIDAIMSDAAQAYYGYIAMPVFVVVLLASFIYNPMIASLADQWSRGLVRVFVTRFGKVAIMIVGLTALCDLAAVIAGVPVLDFLYKADTAPYLADLIVLVTGGGFLALASLAVLGITIIRFQRVLVPVYAIAAIGAWVLSGYTVAGWGIDGAAWAYFISMASLAVVLVLLFFVGMRVQSSSVPKPIASSEQRDDS